MNEHRYASDTSVSPEKSIAEIERTLRRYGADQYAYGWDGNRAMIGFGLKGRQIRIHLPLPDKERFHKTPTGRKRHGEAIDREWEQACRQSYRALALAIKAKLESVEAGISTFEQEFLAHILLPGGQTIGEYAIPRLPEFYKTGRVMNLLPASVGKEE